jgi:hypothetical protein
VVVDILNEINVSLVEILSGDLVRATVVISAHLDDDQVGGLLGRHVVLFRLVVVHGAGARARVGGSVPVPDHSVGAATVALQVDETGSGVCLRLLIKFIVVVVVVVVVVVEETDCDAEFDVAEALCVDKGPGRECFVRRVLSTGEATLLARFIPLV